VKVRTAWTVGIWWLLLLSAVVASPAKDKQPAYQNVDAGSFGVFMNGHRVATEKFSIQQNASGSVATSEFKTDIATAPALQTSELELAPNGDLRKYEWKEVSPGKARAVITPNDNLLVERSTNTPQDKEEEHPFLLPLSTSVLDDYFFIQDNTGDRFLGGSGTTFAQFDVNTDRHIPEFPADAFWKSGSGGHTLYMVPSLDLVVWKLGGRDGQYEERDTGVAQPML